MMPEPSVSVHDHITPMMGLDNAALADCVAQLKDDLAHDEPLAVLVRGAVDTAIAGLEEAPASSSYTSGRHDVSIVETHRLPNDELYWGSGYPYLR